MSLADLTYHSGRPQYRSRHLTEPESALDGYLEQAHRIFDEASSGYADQPPEEPQLSDNFQSLRWFPLPSDVLGGTRRSD
jgi:hypothetical protein